MRNINKPCNTYKCSVSYLKKVVSCVLGSGTGVAAQFEKITKKYGLDLNGGWNKAAMPHQGRHPNAYHDFMLNEMRRIDGIAKGNKDKFLKLFNNVKKDVLKNPDMVTKKYWH